MLKGESLHQQILKKPWIGMLIISSFYFFGTFGIIAGFGDWFVPKTAFNLLLSFLVLLLYQEKINYKLFIALLSCYVIGFTAEYLGVAHGFIFGDYFYPHTLGPQLLGVPIIIGVNWYLITFTVWSVLAKWTINPWLKVLLAAIFTTLIDVLIEPVAIALDFWKWDTVEVPFQNYVGWLVISLIIFGIYQGIQMPTKNKVALTLLGWQLFFFMVLNIFL